MLKLYQNLLKICGKQGTILSSQKFVFAQYLTKVVPYKGRFLHKTMDLTHAEIQVK